MGAGVVRQRQRGCHIERPGISRCKAHLPVEAIGLPLRRYDGRFSLDSDECGRHTGRGDPVPPATGVGGLVVLQFHASPRSGPRERRCDGRQSAGAEGFGQYRDVWGGR